MKALTWAQAKKVCMESGFKLRELSELFDIKYGTISSVFSINARRPKTSASARINMACWQNFPEISAEVSKQAIETMPLAKRAPRRKRKVQGPKKLANSAKTFDRTMRAFFGEYWESLPEDMSLKYSQVKEMIRAASAAR